MVIESPSTFNNAMIRFPVLSGFEPNHLYYLSQQTRLLYVKLLRKFENRRNNICLILLLDARSFRWWCTFLKMFEIPA